MFTKKIRAKEELVNGRATGIKIPFSFMPCLRNERERNGFGVLSAPKEIAKKGGQSLFYRKSMDYFFSIPITPSRFGLKTATSLKLAVDEMGKDE